MEKILPMNHDLVKRDVNTPGIENCSCGTAAVQALTDGNAEEFIDPVVRPVEWIPLVQWRCKFLGADAMGLESDRFDSSGVCRPDITALDGDPLQTIRQFVVSFS